MPAVIADLVLNWPGRRTGTVTLTGSKIVYYRTGERSAVMREILLRLRRLARRRICSSTKVEKMLSTSLARVLSARGIHYGWVMVALAMGYGMCSSATLSIPGVLLVPMSAEFGWSWIYASHQLGAGAMALAAGESRDALASYLPAFFAAGLLCLVATLSLLLLRDRARPPRVGRQEDPNNAMVGDQRYA